MNKKENHASQDYSDRLDVSVANFNQKQSSLNDVVTIDTLHAAHPDLFTKPQLSWLLKTRHANGLSQLGAVLKISRKLYIKKSLFVNWFLEQKASDS